MKKIIHLLILLPLVAFSQTYSIDYDVKLNDFELNGKLVVPENDTAFYYESFKTEDEVKTEQTYDNGKESININISTGFDPALKRHQFYLKEEARLTNLDFLGNEEILIQEEYPNMKWKIESETKQIANYTCYKASTTFRGRTWIAWFTTELPIQVGPWKFVNLPGAILQVYNEEGKLSWNATKISFDNAGIVPFDINKKNVKTVSLKEFIDLQNKSRRQQTNQIISRSFQRGSVQTQSTKVIRGGRELIYEWEKN